MVQVMSSFRLFCKTTVFLLSVTTTKSAPANTWESAYLSQTTGCLLDRFPRIKPERVYWKTSARSQVTFYPRGDDVSPGNFATEGPWMCPRAEGLQEVILYHQPDDKKKNRGFCFLEYEDHKSAAQARRRLMSGKVKVWGNPVTVEWADPVAEPDPEVMAKVRKSLFVYFCWKPSETFWAVGCFFLRSHAAFSSPTQVKVLFVRKLATAVTEELLEKTFSQFGKLERVKKLKDYAFVHFEERDAAVKVLCFVCAMGAKNRLFLFED